MEMAKKPSRSGFYMKTMLKKILFILLFFSAAVPSAMQANGGALSGAIVTSFLAEHKISMGVGAVIGIAFVWKALKEARKRKLRADLSSAIEDCDMEAIEQALLYWADFDQKNGQKVLVQAAFGGYLKVVELLLATEKVGIDKQDSDGYSALMSAAGNGHLKIVELLLATEKVDINKKANDGSTALMEASGNGHLKVVGLLLKHKAKVDMQDDDGWSALIYASSYGQPKIVELLFKHGAKVDMQDKDGSIPLRFAVEYGQSKVVELLLATKKVNVNWQDILGRTPLRLAASWENLTYNPEERQKYTKIIDQLIAAKADLWAIAKNGTTILDENSETINKHMGKIMPGILMKLVESELSLELPDDLANLAAKFAYQSLPECELVQ